MLRDEFSPGSKRALAAYQVSLATVLPTLLATACSETRRKYIHVGLCARVHAGDSLGTGGREQRLRGTIEKFKASARLGGTVFCYLNMHNRGER